MWFIKTTPYIFPQVTGTCTSLDSYRQRTLDNAPADKFSNEDLMYEVNTYRQYNDTQLLLASLHSGQTFANAMECLPANAIRHKKNG